MQIVLARLDSDVQIVRQGRIDLGERHTFRTIAKPVAVMWVNNGTNEDLTKAYRFAAAEGYRVFCYTDEKAPLERAKKEISA